MTTTAKQRSVLAILRDLVPQRPLRFTEALRIAELQANRLLDMAPITGPPVPTDLIAALPRIQVEARARMPVACSARRRNHNGVTTQKTRVRTLGGKE